MAGSMHFWNSSLDFQCINCYIALEKPIIEWVFMGEVYELHGICETHWKELKEKSKDEPWFVEWKRMTREWKRSQRFTVDTEVSLDRRNRRGTSLYDHVYSDLDGKYADENVPRSMLPEETPEIKARVAKEVERLRSLDEEKTIRDVVRQARKFKIGWKLIQNALKEHHNINASNDKISRIMREVAQEHQHGKKN